MAEGLGFSDVEALLVKLADAAGSVVLVGGQAVNVWAEQYGDRVEELQASGPFTSKDIDFCGYRQDVERIAAKLGGTARIAGFDDHTPQVGTVTFDLRGVTRTIDIMANLTGLESEDVFKTSIPFQFLPEGGEPIEVPVMHPVLVLESRAHNVIASEKYRTAHGLGQLRASFYCAREFLKTLCNEDVKKTLKWNERVFRFRKSTTGKRVATEYGVDAFDALCIDARLPPAFLEKRYPQMQGEVAKLRSDP